MSEILVDNLTGKTSAGDITVTSEGGAATQSLQQGLAKAWMDVATTTVNDSLNVASISDGGDWLNMNFTNSMSSGNYAVPTGGSQSGYTANKGTSIGVSDTTTSSNKQWPMTEAHAGYAGGAFDYHTCAVFGDLA